MRMSVLVVLALVLSACATSAAAPDQAGPAAPLADAGAGPEAASAVTAEADRTPAQDLPTGPPDCVSSESDTHRIDRLGGQDRFATATCASQLAFPSTVATVVLARGDDAGGYADALAGTVLADAVGGPVLLTAPDRLPDATRDELTRLEPDTVLLLGGPSAISAQVAAEVRALGPATERVAGDDRAETAAAVAQRAGATGKAFVVNGFRPADALVAGAAAARADAALLLATDRGLPQVTRDALAGMPSAVIVGGHGVVGEAAEAELRQLVPAVRRLSGASRSETAASVARALPQPGVVHLAGAADRNLVDAIAAGWLAARPGGGPVLYSAPSTPGHGTDRYLRLGGLNGQPDIRLVGGTAVLAPELVDVLETRLDEAAAGGPPAQVRGMWIHLFDDTLKSRRTIHRMLDAATAANLNTVIVQVARRHDSYYTSDVLPRTPDPRMPADLDLLAELVPAAHARGLKVHAWFSIAPVFHQGAYGDLAMPANHVWVQHGHGGNACTPPDTSQCWMTRAQDGTWSSTYLDVGVPAVQDHVVAMIQEVAARYAVDGIHLDYLRYPEGGNWGYNPAALARHQAEGGDFSNWRRAQTERLATRIRDEVRTARPGVQVSMAAIAQGDGPAGVGGWEQTKAYREVYQDWRGWLERDVVDAAFPMMYFREETHGHWYDRWVDFTRGVAQSELLAVGQGAFLNTVGQSAAQVGEALAATDGLIVYSYQQDVKDPSREPTGALLRWLAAGPFATPAPYPTG